MASKHLGLARGFVGIIYKQKLERKKKMKLSVILAGLILWAAFVRISFIRRRLRKFWGAHTFIPAFLIGGPLICSGYIISLISTSDIPILFYAVGAMVVLAVEWEEPIEVLEEESDRRLGRFLARQDRADCDECIGIIKVDVRIFPNNIVE